MARTHFFVLIALCSVIYFSDEVKANCGGLRVEDNGIITSPSYPSDYPPNKNCTWEIRMPPNNRIVLHFKFFRLEESNTCVFDYLTIKSKMEDGSVREHGKFCGSQTIPNITSHSNVLLIQFKSDGSNQYKGFEVAFGRDCGGLRVEDYGTITSPSYPSNYPPNKYCSWEIRMPPNNRIVLHFKFFHLEVSSTCNFDYITLKSKMEDGRVREHGKFCGSQTIPNITSDSNILLIQFVSDSSNQFKGFEVAFVRVPYECGGLIEREKNITSPLFPFPYPPDLDCTWHIQAPKDHQIKLIFTDFTTEDRDYVIVQSKMADGEIREHGKFCGQEIPPVIFSERNILLIQFVSNGTSRYKGFKAEVSFEGCGGLIEGSRGNISTPFYPYSYPPDKVCEWSILLSPQHKIKLRFLHFEVEGEDKECSNDFLLIQRKTADGELHEHGKYCGIYQPPSFIYSKDTILLTFVSDRSIQNKGFKAEYFIDKWTDYEISTSKSSMPVSQYGKYWNGKYLL